MNRRRFIALSLAATGAAFAPRPGSAAVPLETLSEYFNGIRTLEAGFTQFNADGSRSTGRLYLRRPGRARFEYDPPEETLVMAGGGQVAVFDGRSNAHTPEQYPLKRTPLYIILERNVDLARRNMVIGHSGDDETTRLIAQDPDAPENGQVELVFRNDPLTLAGWIVTDGQGTQTRVQLDRIALGGEIPARLFNIQIEQQSRGR